MMSREIMGGVLGAALLLVGTQVQADISWSFGGNSVSSTVGNTKTQTSGGVAATAQAWSNTDNGKTSGSGASGPLGSNSLATSASYKLQTAYLNVYSGGLGVKNLDASSSSSYGDQNDGSSPEHSVDNNQRYDSVLFSFNSAIDLNSVTIGWSQTDSDISILAYTGTGSCVGAGTCSADMTGKTYAQLASYGWSLIGQYGNLVTNVAKSVNSGNVASSYWLIGAANPLVGGTADGTSDYVKLLALSGDKVTPPCTPGTPGCGGGGGQVPEPGTLLLMGAGLFGLTRINARRGDRSTV
ncbi:exosortase-dependent surface protein XDP1 [Thiobacillus sp.]